jgi:serine/threonine protein kinase
MSLKKLGRYELLRVLGKGAMGIVYEGRDPNLDRRVAIKTVKVENLSEEAAAEYESRFRTEARSAARLQHPHIVSVYDSDRDGDIAFLVMEYIHGDDLKHHLDQGVRYSLEASLKIMRELLSALDYAHRQGIVHRDIKPANLLLQADGCVKLTDFGVARIEDAGEATRTQGAMVGTLKYMAPEQVQGLKIDARADLFSAGVVLYQLLTDKRPFDAENDFSIIQQIVSHTPPPPSSIHPALPPEIDAVVARALAKNRDERFATASDFAAALHAALGRVEDATVVPPADPAKKVDGLNNVDGALPVPGSSVPSVGGGSQASVTQELELVYWKEVKDSTEADVLQGFLQRFPEGIYADLARRRVRRLADATSDDQTQLAGLAGLTAPAASSMSKGTVVGHSPPAVATASDDVQAQSSAPRAQAHASRPPAEAPLPDPSQGTPTAQALPAADPVPRPRSRKLTPGLVTVVTALVVVTAGLMWTSRGTSADSSAAMSNGPAVANVAAATSPGVTPVVATSPAPSAASAEPADLKPSKSVAKSAAAERAARASAGKAASTAPATAKVATAAVASAPRKTASAARTKQRPAPSSAPPASTTAAGVAAPPAARSPDEAKASEPAPASSVRAASPMETCRDRMFLAREYCLHTECAKPSFQNTPMCVRRRDEARQREENRIRN